MTATTTLDDVRKTYALDQEQAAIDLRGLLSSTEAPPIALGQRSLQRRTFVMLVSVIAMAALLIVAALQRNEYLRVQARSEQLKAQVRSQQLLVLARDEELRALARTEIANLASWDNAAQALLEDEISPAVYSEVPGQQTLRTPAQILKLHEEFLARRSGPAWQGVSAAQAENVKSIGLTYVAGFTALRQAPELEALLYGRAGVSLSANLTADQVSEQLNAALKISAAIAKTQTAWGPLPSNAPREHVGQIFDLAGSRLTLLEAEISLLRYLADNPRAWTLVRHGDVRMPVFSKPALQTGFKQLLDTEARDGAALLQNLSDLVGPALAQQLKSPL